MSLNIEQNRELVIEATRAENSRRLVNLFEQSLDDEEHTFGYHGTSIEAIEYAMNDGTLPGGSYEPIDPLFNPNTLSLPASVYIVPKKPKSAEQSVQDWITSTSVSNVKRAIDSASGFAGVIARQHFLLSRLGFTLNSDVRTYHAIIEMLNTVDYENVDEYIFNYSVDKVGSIRNLNKLVKEANSQRGLVLGIKDVSGDPRFEMFAGADGDDIGIRCTQGLPIDTFSGLEPLGQREWDYFENLQKQNA